MFYQFNQIYCNKFETKLVVFLKNFLFPSKNSNLSNEIFHIPLTFESHKPKNEILIWQQQFWFVFVHNFVCFDLTRTIQWNTIAIPTPTTIQQPFYPTEHFNFFDWNCWIFYWKGWKYFNFHFLNIKFNCDPNWGKKYLLRVLSTKMRRTFWCEK